jgi:hypothetical protein
MSCNRCNENSNLEGNLSEGHLIFCELSARRSLMVEIMKFNCSAAVLAIMLLLADSSLEHDPISKLELDEAKEDVKMEPVEVYKEGMVVPPREDGRPPEPPEGFTIHTTESGVMVLRRKRQRNLQKLGKL